MIHLEDFLLCLTRETTFVTSCLSSHQAPSESSEKGSTLKGKNLGSKFFPFKVNLFSKGRYTYFERAASLYRVSIPLNPFILNRLSHTIYWKSPISVLGMSGYEN